jgi:hypothetical protein
MDRITESEIERSREDPRFKQVLLARSLEQLLSSMHRMQHAARRLQPAEERHLREGALMAVQLADMIRAIDDRLLRMAMRQAS